MAFESLCGDYCLRSGLCYDSTGDDYKAVLSLSSYCDDDDDDFVGVISFRNKSRSVIQYFPYMISTMDSGPIVNAKLHWFACKNDSGSQHFSPHRQIIYFDAHVDKFEEVPMPVPKRGDGDIIVALGVLDECLCMSRWVDCPALNVEVLVMKEFGVKKSWTILFAVSDWLRCNLNNGLVPLDYTKNGEVLAMVTSHWTLEEDKDWHIRAFNPTDNSHRGISTPKELDFYPIIYEESLIRPTGYDCEEES